MPARRVETWRALCAACFALNSTLALPAAVNPADGLGPYNDTFLEGGIGVSRPLDTAVAPLAAQAPWSISGWLLSAHHQPGTRIVAAWGDVAGGAWQGIVLTDDKLALSLGSHPTLVNRSALEPQHWYAFAATYDGTTAHLFVDGREIAAARAATSAVAARIEIAPTAGNSKAGLHFGGSVANLTLLPHALSANAVAQLARARPDFSLIVFNNVGVGWPLQEHAWRGLLEPQDPSTLPRSKSPASAPVAEPEVPESRGLISTGAGTWNVGGWRLTAANALHATAESLSKPGFPMQAWYQAVVPGTVLTTLIARGVYPDPYYGLNNLVIPESLSREDYWYRSEFTLPSEFAGRNLTLTFKGINYGAEVWLNGTRVGAIRGAFIRGVFDVTRNLIAGSANAIAVHISPPPHPGIPHEESIAAGPGENGGALALDGPTFIASEGWDWIPGIRDRNSGIWQEVELKAGGTLHILDPHVTTQLPLPRIDAAEVSIAVPVENRSAMAVQASIDARFESVHVTKNVTLPPGISEVLLESREFAQLHLKEPRLWWPNGYGPANLYTLTLAVSDGNILSDSAQLRFGVRQLTYELSLFDHDGRLRRVEVDPTAGTARGERLVDVRHQAIKRTPQGWAASLTLAGEHSPAVRPVASESLKPYLVLRVNGVAIAARGGSWGTDDARKRISRARLEPYFKLHHEAHLNIIRNWLGQNTEDIFYDLADEYGLLVLNDFWASTQDFQLEPEDPALFLANARDVISRYRNHPSIALWFGRNEGVPQPIINEGLAELVASLDGSRYYSGSSNRVNLQDSGPYNYRPPEQYFTTLAKGFSVEVGTPSLSTLESLQASIPPAERWPLSDSIAYHDWHFGGNGNVASFMAALADQYGQAADLEDFERKAQLMDYVTYRAIFEGFQAHLWTQNSGRLLWMTHPSWPSNTWQIYSSDYDTAAAYYAVQKACEPVHVQLNLPAFSIAVANTTRAAQNSLALTSRIFSLDNRLLGERRETVRVAANSVATLAPLALKDALASEGLVLVVLTLNDAGGKTLSRSVYWQGRDSQSQRRLNELAPQPVEITTEEHSGASETTVDVKLVNNGTAAAVAAKITMLDAAGARVLPVYLNDNYVTLLPGETTHVLARCPRAGVRCARVALRGWDVAPRVAQVTEAGGN